MELTLRQYILKAQDLLKMAFESYDGYRMEIPKEDYDAAMECLAEAIKNINFDLGKGSA